MELAAESLVENRKIENFRDNLADLKTSQQKTASILEQVLCSLEGVKGAESSVERIESVRRGIESNLADLRLQISEIGEYSRRSAQLSSRLYSEVLASKSAHCRRCSNVSKDGSGFGQNPPGKRLFWK